MSNSTQVQSTKLIPAQISAKITIEYEQDGKLTIVSGYVQEPVTLKHEPRYEDVRFDDSYDVYRFRAEEKVLLEFVLDENGHFYQVETREDPNYALGYKRGVEAERKRIKELLSE